MSNHWHMPSRVYVIELSREAGRRRDSRIPWIYVGSSARDPQIRFEQHRRGYKSSGRVKRFALRLRPDLYEDLEPFRSSAQAREGEFARARELAGAGFVAHSDGTSHGERGFWVAAHLDPGDPPPGYGLFSHVRLDVLEQRVVSNPPSGGLARAIQA